ncbi:MAG: hypothetical protein ACTSRP_09025 [Candidatus Helarchaeota archaeon]
MTNKNYNDYTTTKYLITAQIVVEGIVENLFNSQSMTKSTQTGCGWSPIWANRRFIG